VKIEKILVPVDFSECSRVALEHAVHYANAFGVQRIDVLHVWEPPRRLTLETKVTQEGREETLGEFLQSQAGQSMKEFLTRVEGSGAFKAQGRLESGEPHKTIIEVAESEAFDLIVMGTTGESTSTQLGSNTQRVVRRAPCPVLTIRTP
jgi:nucleotide-binding universal stress UspA family protein